MDINVNQFIERYKGSLSEELHGKLLVFNNKQMSDFWAKANVFDKIDVLIAMNCFDNMKFIFFSFSSKCLFELSHKEKEFGEYSKVMLDFYNNYLSAIENMSQFPSIVEVYANQALEYSYALSKKSSFSSGIFNIFVGFFSDFPSKDIKAIVYRIISVGFRLKKQSEINAIFDKSFRSPFHA